MPDKKKPAKKIEDIVLNEEETLEEGERTPENAAAERAALEALDAIESERNGFDSESTGTGDSFSSDDSLDSEPF